MPAPYGITNSGFSTKTLPEQLVELELANRAIFGSGVVQDPQSPLGQLNGLYADVSAEVWEMAQELYGSFDIDQAHGVRLDAIGKLRKSTRIDGQTDAEFRAMMRQSGYGDTKTRQLRNKLLAVDGVTFVQIVENSSSVISNNGVDPKSVAVVVVGGLDSDVGSVIWNNTVPGIGLQGSTTVSINNDGYCNSVSFIRPVDVSLKIEIDVSIHIDQCDCAPDDVLTITSNVHKELSDGCGMQSGSIITPASIERLASQSSGIVVEAVRISRDDATPSFQNVAFNLYERPVVDIAQIITTVVAHTGSNTTQGSLS